MGVSALLTALSVAGAGLGAVGAVQQGRADARAAEFNARSAEQQAAQERFAAAAEAKDYRRGETRRRASAAAARAAAGITSAGSPLLVDEAMVREAALGSARIKYGGDVRAKRLEDEADLYKMRAKNSRRAGYLKAGTSLLNSAGSWAYG